MKIVYNIAIELVLFGALFGTFALGNEGAHNLFTFFAWFLAITGLIIGFSAQSKKRMRAKAMSVNRIAYLTTRDAIVVFASAWLGMPILATTYAVMALLLYSARTSKEPEVA